MRGVAIFDLDYALASTIVITVISTKLCQCVHMFVHSLYQVIIKNIYDLPKGLDPNRSI